MKDKLYSLMRGGRFRELLRYIFIGGCTTLVNYLLYSLLFYKLNVEMNLSNTVAIVCSIIFAYVANKIFVFQSRCENFGALLREMAKFFSARAVTMLLEIGGVFLVHSVVKVDKMYSIVTKIILSVAVLCLNYIFSKLIIFKKDSNPG